jgi:CheY-like chemotaxis protein
MRDLGDLLQASVGSECNLHVELGDDGVVEGDVTRLSQVILNLVTNAYEALEEGRGNVTLRTGRDHFDEAMLAGSTGSAQAMPGEYAWFEVTDDGSGMDEATRRRIFEPFFTTKFSGRGLGLASAMGIIRAHGGRVELSSELGVGTRVRVLLPPSTREPMLELAPQSVDARPERVLIVDDDEAVLELAEEFLHRAGYASLRATGGEEAIELFQKKAAEIDAVVLDLTMPDIDGREVFQAIRRVRADVPVVLATGYSRGMLEETFPDETRLSFLRKPYDPEQLLEAIHAAGQPKKT